MSLFKFRKPALEPVPAWLWPSIIILTLASFLPLVLIAKERATRASRTRVQIIPDMDQQPKFRPQSANPLFADARAMRPPVPGTVEFRQPAQDPHLDLGQVDGQWATTFPMPVTAELLRRGRERYDVFCAPCHGLGGRGDGPVHVRAERLEEGTWTPPASFHTDIVINRPVGHLYNTITHGIRNMPAYGGQIPVGDRWAIVAYARALQRSNLTVVGDVPSGQVGALR